MGAYEDMKHKERYDHIPGRKSSETESDYDDRYIKEMFKTDERIEKEENDSARDEMRAWARRNDPDYDRR